MKAIVRRSMATWRDIRGSSIYWGFPGAASYPCGFSAPGLPIRRPGHWPTLGRGHGSAHRPRLSAGHGLAQALARGGRVDPRTGCMTNSIVSSRSMRLPDHAFRRSTPRLYACPRRRSEAEWMHAARRELNQSSTTFVEERSDAFSIRWFTRREELVSMARARCARRTSCGRRGVSGSSRCGSSPVAAF